MLRRFVDGRLLGLAETPAKIIEQYPDILSKSSGKDGARAAEVDGNNKEPHALQDVTHSLRVFSPDDRLVWKAPNASAQQALPDHLLEQVRRGAPVLEISETTDG